MFRLNTQINSIWDIGLFRKDIIIMVQFLNYPHSSLNGGVVARLGDFLQLYLRENLSMGQKVNQIIFCPGADADAELGFRRYIITFTTALWANMQSFWQKRRLLARHDRQVSQ